MRLCVGRLALGLTLLGVSACSQSKVEPRPKPKPEVVAQLELQIDAPGMPPESVEQSIVAPIELALIGNSDIRGMVAEAEEGRARIRLALSNRGELVAVDVLQRVAAIESQLPEDAEPLVLSHRPPAATMLHFAFAREDAAKAQTLLAAIERTTGVSELRRCGLDQVLAIEIHPTVASVFAVDIGEIEAAVRLGLGVEPATTAEQLGKLVVSDLHVELDQFAAIQLEPRARGCRAFSQQGHSVGVSVMLAHAEARARVEPLLDEARELGLQRFPSYLHVWLDPALDPQWASSLIREVVQPQWLLEVGVEAEPCQGPGTLARLHLPDGIATDAIIDALAAIPGVMLVERPEAPWARRWLLGPNPELLARHGNEAVARAAEAGGLALLVGGPVSTTVIELDRNKLDIRDIDRSAAYLSLAVAHGGLEMGHIRDRAGERLAVVLRLPSELTDDISKLAELPIAVRDGTVPLSAVAELRTELAPTRICRRDGERGVVVLVRPQDADLRGAIELSPGYSWAADR